MCWQSVGKVLAKCWWSVGSVGDVLAKCWWCVGKVLVMCWPLDGQQSTNSRRQVSVGHKVHFYHLNISLQIWQPISTKNNQTNELQSRTKTRWQYQKYVFLFCSILTGIFWPSWILNFRAHLGLPVMSIRMYKTLKSQNTTNVITFVPERKQITWSILWLEEMLKEVNHFIYLLFYVICLGGGVLIENTLNKVCLEDFFKLNLFYIFLSGKVKKAKWIHEHVIWMYVYREVTCFQAILDFFQFNTWFCLTKHLRNSPPGIEITNLT